jgi:Sec-independent protein translocase protein TatA
MAIELLLAVGLGFLLLGPKRMHETLGQLGRAKAQFDKAAHGIKAQLTAELGSDAGRAEQASLVSEKSPSVEA